MKNNYPVKAISGKSIHLDVVLPGSKSISNRALLIAALAEGETRISNLLFSEDTVYMSKALTDLGLDISLDEKGKCCVIKGGKLPSRGQELFVGNAGTAMRFLTSYLALGRGNFILDGNERMRQRPIGDLLSALRQLDCDVESLENNACPPVLIRAHGMRGGECVINGKNSSQYISSVLMAAPYSERGVKIFTEGEAASLPYIDMTIRMMKQFGVSVTSNDFHEFEVKSARYHALESYTVEPDASSASYFLAAGAILSGSVKIRNLGKNSLQGDAKFAFVLQKMGCTVSCGEDYIELKSDGKLKGITIDMNEMPDTVPTLAIAALFADSPTKITNVANLRIKESDRISALASELKKLGAFVAEHPDGLEIFPAKNYHPVSIATYDDHRIAMAFSIAGLKIDGIEIENPACVAKSFPDFFDVLERTFY
jgi:3-phosphoshikimate 1-carboxyvinyltransferase